ncbi:MAG: class I SAM-dependent methyltransferase [Gemmatimonadales bacterium]
MPPLTSFAPGAESPPARALPLRETVACLNCGSAEALPVTASRVQMADDPERFTWQQCRACGLVYLSPRVSEAAIGRYYEDYLPHRGSAAWGRWAPLVDVGQRGTDKARLKTVQRVLPLGPGRTLLDVGCGRPTFLRLAQRGTGARAIGLDFDASGWEHDPGEWAGLELHAGVLDDVALSVPPDVITLWHVLEHLYAPVESLRQLRQLAKPGTRLIIEVPDHAGLTRRLQGSCWAGYHTPRHTAVYTPATLRAVLERAGWRVERQYQWGTLDPYVLWWLGQQERRQRSLSGSLESRFLPFLAGKILSTPIVLAERFVPLGFQTAIATI